ncbi:MAG TPA: response regulator [Cyclobacteriaceae bacterium]|nr:response regulator [Cyclobacteriaceae bacterium]
MDDNPDRVIALVDDDKIFQLIATRSIKATHFTGKILQFNNGSEAIHYLEQHASNNAELPDVLFLDINMPLVDGWMFMEDFVELKSKIHKPIRIYMVSSSIDPKDIERAKGISDIRDYITKPVSQQKFADLISEAVN